MPSPLETRAALKLLTTAAVATSGRLYMGTSGTPEARRLELLNGVPEIVGYFADGSSALAADYYDEQREIAGVSGRFSAEPIVNDRVVKIRRAVAWAAEPLFQGDDVAASLRLAEVVQLESARPFRDTITANRRTDPAAAGWKRITAGGCKLCRMLADRGAVYREATARFAAHPNCHCTASPVFFGQEDGPEASVLQYTASKRNRTPGQQAQLREYLATFD